MLKHEDPHRSPHRSPQRTCRSGGLRALALGTASVIGLTIGASQAQAQTLATVLPNGGQVVTGDISIDQSGASMTVTQGSDRGIINWQGFDIGSEASVVFLQPGSGSATLNRVFSGAGSTIAGKLSANGKVYVVNPNGVLFTKSAQVDVGGLVAAAGDISNADFLAGRDNFVTTGAKGGVVNEGRITARDGGQVVLVGGTVSNFGVINAVNGDVALAAGSKIRLNAGADGHLKVEVDASSTAALIENGGLISAGGGQVLMTAQGLGEALSSVVSNTGIVEARTLEGKSGRIVLLAGMTGGEVKAGGRLDASAPDGGDGGFVETSAAKVTIAQDAMVTTLSNNGKSGEWLIDPHDVTISTDFDTGGFTATADDTVINVDTLKNALATTGVTISTGSGGGQAGHITVAASIDWSANTTLTLNAAGSIFFDKSVAATGAGAGLVLNYTGDYKLGLGSRITLSGAGAGLSINGTNYTLVRDAAGLQSLTDGNFALAQDIDATATKSWNGGAGFAPVSFTGTFLGLGNTVDGMTINRPTQGIVGPLGLFSGVLRDITFSNVDIRGGQTVGGVIGRQSGGSMSNVHVTGSVYSTHGMVGGVTGWSDIGGIFNSSSTASVWGGGAEVGGLVGRARISVIQDAYATGSVTGTGADVGGLVGRTVQGGTIARSYASGAVSGATGVGGLVGREADALGADTTGALSLTNAFWDVESTGQATSASGLGQGISWLAARTQATYTGFDFTNIWTMTPGETRPMLRGEYSTTIYTPHQLQLAALDLTASYRLGTNIDFGSAFTAGANGFVSDVWGVGGFLPIALGSVFTGDLNGQGYDVRGVKIVRGATQGVGLVSNLEGSIRNISVSGDVTGDGEVGGLVGHIGSFGTVMRSSASANVTGGASVGGLVGYNMGAISQSYATGEVRGVENVGGLVGGNLGVVEQSYAAGRVSVGVRRGGGLIGDNLGSVRDTYAMAPVVGDAGSLVLGGLVGRNVGAIERSYSTGRVMGGLSLGGSVGQVISGALTDVYWDVLTSGLTVGVASGSTAGGLATPALQGSLPNGFSSAIWGTGTYLYPYFQWNYATTPLAVSGYVYNPTNGAFWPVGKVSAVSGGQWQGSGYAGANGYYYILTPAGAISSSGVLSYLDNGAMTGAGFSDLTTPAGLQSLNVTTLGVLFNTSQSSLTATEARYLATRGAYADDDLAFLSSSGFASLTTAGNGVIFSTPANYSLDMSVASGDRLMFAGSSFNLNGSQALSANGLLLVGGAIQWGDGSQLNLSTTSGDLGIAGAVTAANGGLFLDAPGAVSVGGPVNLGTFGLASGTWIQVGGSLPAFAARDFRLSRTATFLRATGGAGTGATPYLISDSYGLQGLASYGLADKAFQLGQSIDLAGTANWNGGSGFLPIGDAVTPFVGMLSGQSYVLRNLRIDRSARNLVGLFGRIGSGGQVRDLGLIGSVIGRDQVGLLAGANAGTVSGVYTQGSVDGSTSVGGFVGANSGAVANSMSTADVTGASAGIGGLVGENAVGGSIADSYATGSVSGIGPASRVGGVAGENAGSLQRVYATGPVSGAGLVGGVAGAQSGTISGSFWDVASTGQSQGVGLGALAGMAGLSSTDMTNLSIFASAGWTIDDLGGTGATWRIYEGHTAPLLRGFMTSLTVTGGASGKIYDGNALSNDVGTLTYSAAHDASMILGTASYRAGGANVGAYAGSSLTLMGLYSSQFGYDLDLQSGSLIVTPAPLTVTVRNASKVYDGLAWSGGAGATYSGFVNGEAASVLGGALIYGGSAVGAVNAGTYTLSASGLTAGNYAITYASGGLTIDKAALTVKLNNASKVYDGRAWSGGAGAIYSGFVNGETASVLGGSLVYGGAAQGAVNAGSYALTGAGLISGNYVISYAPAALTVTPRGLTVTANSKTVAFGGSYLPLTYTLTGDGLAAGDVLAQVLGGALATNAVTSVPGDYAITRGDLSVVSGNYALAGFVDGVLTVERTKAAPAGGELMRAARPVSTVALDDGSALQRLRASPDIETQSVPLALEPDYIRVSP